MNTNQNEAMEVFLDAKAFNEANKQHAIAYGALLITLIDKGVITQEEYDRTHAQATAIIDQEFARKRDDAEKDASAKQDEMESELKRLYPGMLGDAIVKMFRKSTKENE